jgi:flagellar protein FliO/FliZ
MKRLRRFAPAILRSASAQALVLAAAAAGAAQGAPATPAVVPQSAATASASGFFQVLLGLLVVLALLAAIAWLLKRFNVSRIAGNAPVKIVGGVSVGNRERVVVVEVAGQWIVVGVAPGQVNALSTLPRAENAPPAAPGQQQAGDSFAVWLKQKIDKRNAE